MEDFYVILYTIEELQKVRVRNGFIIYLQGYKLAPFNDNPIILLIALTSGVNEV